MEEHNEPDPHRLEPWDWEQPESVERRVDPKNGIEDYFSTTAEMRAQQSLHDKEQKKLTDSLNADVEDFTSREINTVEDTYAVKSQYQSITSRLPLLDERGFTARLLEQVENRYDYFEGIISQMSDTLALYEKQKAAYAAKAPGKGHEGCGGTAQTGREGHQEK